MNLVCLLCVCSVVYNIYSFVSNTYVNSYIADTIGDTNGSTSILKAHREMHEALDAVSNLHDLCLWAKKGIEVGWPINNFRALTHNDVQESSFMGSLKLDGYKIAMEIVAQARRVFGTSLTSFVLLVCNKTPVNHCS